MAKAFVPNKNRNAPHRNMPQPETEEFRLNDQIKVPEVRLVGKNLAELSEQLGSPIETGVYPTRQVKEWADKLEIDMIEISPNAVPPVVNLMDYAKFVYQRKKHEKEMKANAVKTVIKEIRFGPNTDDHDLEFKTKHAENFLREGAKVKAYVQFKGRSIVFQDRGELILLRFIQGLEEVGTPEALPKLEGRKMLVTMVPKKKAGK